jgi:hypothetical protein
VAVSTLPSSWYIPLMAMLMSKRYCFTASQRTRSGIQLPPGYRYLQLFVHPLHLDRTTHTSGEHHSGLPHHIGPVRIQTLICLYSCSLTMMCYRLVYRPLFLLSCRTNGSAAHPRWCGSARSRADDRPDAGQVPDVSRRGCGTHAT